MGSYSYFRIGRHCVEDEKHGFDDRLILLFRQGDLAIVEASEADEESLFRKCEYISHAGLIRDRLDLMGFTLARAEEAFEQLRDERAHAILRARGDDAAETRMLENVGRSMSFKDWLEAVKRVMKLKSLYEPWPMKLPLPRNPSAFDFVRRCPLMYFGFCGSEPRHFVRACTQVVAPGTKVALDLTDLANDEIFEPDPNLFDHLFTDAAVEYARTTPVIVLTEGTSDTQILQKSLKVLYPHLEGFFSFMEFEGFKVPGGAGNLTNVVKAFAGSAVQNRIVAVFDNDTAAHDAIRAMRHVHLPANMAICLLPPLQSLSRYPTVGPHGPMLADINGKAASIELYLGYDVVGRGNARKKVRWTGFAQGIEQYQGEIADKDNLKQAFLTKIERCQARPKMTDKRWKEIRAVWEHIFSTVRTLTNHIGKSVLADAPS